MSGGHGGARANAGRKPKSPLLRKGGRTFSIDQYLIDWLVKTYGSDCNQIINDKIKEMYEQNGGKPVV